MRAPYPAASRVDRHSHRGWDIDLVTYDYDTWSAHLFSPIGESKRLSSFPSVNPALTAARLEIDRLIEVALKEPAEDPKKTRGTKRPPRKAKP